jgi:hypothetical protein
MADHLENIPTCPDSPLLLKDPVKILKWTNRMISSNTRMAPCARETLEEIRKRAAEMLKQTES